jgi:hypothetical protein
MIEADLLLQIKFEDLIKDFTTIEAQSQFGATNLLQS